MANAIVTVRIMPAMVEADLERIKEEAMVILDKEAGPGDRREEIEPVAFGIKALKIIFVVDESKGSPDPIADKIKEIEGVQSCDVIDVRRAVG